MKNIFIGDVHGCYRGLKQLLNESNYKSDDTLWFVGDLVNRGSKSLEVLQFIANLGDKAKVVLGNHDVHMMGVYYNARDYGNKDTFDDVLKFPEVDKYIQWLRSQPFAQYSPDLSILMVHAGVYPGWTLASTLYSSQVLSDKLMDMKAPQQEFTRLFANMPAHWNNKMKSSNAEIASLNAFTRMRYIYQKPNKKSWRLEFDFKGTIDAAQRYETEDKKMMQPWFHQINSDLKEVNVVFGHWSALGFYNHNNITCLDGGYLWGGRMISMVIEGSDLSTKRFHAVANQF